MEDIQTPIANAPTGASGNAAKQDDEHEVTRRERDRLIDEAAAGMVPEHAPKKPEDPLKHWWPQITRKLGQGYSVRQIHTMTCAPTINLGIGLRTFQRMVKQHLAGQQRDEGTKGLRE